jgi:hypothetical protein
MVQAGESEAAQMTKTLSESQSVDDHSKAGRGVVRMYMKRRRAKIMMAPKKKKMKMKMR